jgi:integrase
MEHDAIQLPSRPAPNPQPLESKDAVAPLAAISTEDRRSRDPWPGRDFALAALLLSLGLRVGETCQLRVGDLVAVDDSPRLRVLGNGHKVRKPVGSRDNKVSSRDRRRARRYADLEAQARRE